MNFWKPVTAKIIPDQLKTGLFLATLLELIDPQLEPRDIIKQPTTKAQCIKNLKSCLDKIEEITGEFYTEDNLIQIFLGNPDIAWQIID